MPLRNHIVAENDASDRAVDGEEEAYEISEEGGGRRKGPVRLQGA